MIVVLVSVIRSFIAFFSYYLFRLQFSINSFRGQTSFRIFVLGAKVGIELSIKSFVVCRQDPALSASTFTCVILSWASFCGPKLCRYGGMRIAMQHCNRLSGCMLPPER